MLITGRGATATSVTYRYFFKDRNTANAVDLFGPGNVLVSFVGWGQPSTTFPQGQPAWWTTARTTSTTSTTGWNIAGLTQTFTLDPAAAGAKTAGGAISLGPLSLQGPTIGISDVGFADGMLVLTIALGVDRASLAFGNKPATSGTTATGTSGATGTSTGQTGSGISVDLLGLQGTFDLAVDALGLLSGNVRIEPTGAWGIRIASLEAQIPNVATLNAAGIVFGYDPTHDDAVDGPQELLRIATATITFPSLGVTGSLRPYDPSAGRNVNAPADGAALPSGVVPGLVVYSNGFKLGTAELAYGLPPLPAGQTVQAGNQLTSTQSATDKDINLFGILKLDDLRVGVQGLSVTFGQAVTFTGTIYIATGGATLFPGKAFTASVTDRTTADDVNADGTPNTEALRAQLTFADGKVQSFQLSLDTLSVKLGGYVTLTAVGATVDTAAADGYLVKFLSVGASVRIGSMELTGSAKNFGFRADGSFDAFNGFGVYLSVGSADGASFKWPAFLPVHIDSIGVEWTDPENHPEDFVLVLSASVTEIKGFKGMTFSGSVKGIRIQPSLLAAGEFPIISIDSLGVTVSGKAFGGEITAGLVGGIMRLDSSFNPIGEFDRTTPVAKRVFYLGLQGGFSFGGMAGFTIRLGLSELGPLGVFVSVEVPGGILLEPFSGLTINDFSGGVEFFKSLPSIDDPEALRGASFNLPTAVPADQWLTNLQQQVALQAKRLSADPSLNGFTAAFTAPMVITGSARIYSMYTSQQVFNAQVTVMLSTDGKFLVKGTLFFANNQLSIAGRLYADLSEVAAGHAKILFLADLPDEVRVLSIYGKIEMGFRNSSGQKVTFDVDGASGSSGAGGAPTVTLVDPVGTGGSIDAAKLNTLVDATTGQHYLDVLYQSAPGATIDWLAGHQGHHDVQPHHGWHRHRRRIGPQLHRPSGADDRGQHRKRRRPGPDRDQGLDRRRRHDLRSRLHHRRRRHDHREGDRARGHDAVHGLHDVVQPGLHGLSPRARHAAHRDHPGPLPDRHGPRRARRRPGGLRDRRRQEHRHRRGHRHRQRGDRVHLHRDGQHRRHHRPEPGRHDRRQRGQRARLARRDLHDPGRPGRRPSLDHRPGARVRADRCGSRLDRARRLAGADLPQRDRDDADLPLLGHRHLGGLRGDHHDLPR